MTSICEGCNCGWNHRAGTRRGHTSSSPSRSIAGFAPAWAERGRLDRILSKYENPALVAEAEAAFVAALERDRDSGAAQHYFAQLEIDLGRARSALVRLTRRAAERRAEPQIFAALVHACRYTGLLSASLAANDHARHLDPSISTSVLHTYYLAGDYARALEEGHRTSDPFEARVLGAMGREAEAIDAARREEARFASVPMLQSFSIALHAALEGRAQDAIAALDALEASGFKDGEGLFYVAEICARIGEADRVRRTLEAAVDSRLRLPGGIRSRSLPRTGTCLSMVGTPP